MSGCVHIFRESDGSYRGTWSVPGECQSITVVPGGGSLLVAGNGVREYSPQGALIRTALTDWRYISQAVCTGDHVTLCTPEQLDNDDGDLHTVTWPDAVRIWSWSDETYPGTDFGVYGMEYLEAWDSLVVNIGSVSTRNIWRFAVPLNSIDEWSGDAIAFGSTNASIELAYQPLDNTTHAARHLVLGWKDVVTVRAVTETYQHAWRPQYSIDVGATQDIAVPGWETYGRSVCLTSDGGGFAYVGEPIDGNSPVYNLGGKLAILGFDGSVLVAPTARNVLFKPRDIAALGGYLYVTDTIPTGATYPPPNFNDAPAQLHTPTDPLFGLLHQVVSTGGGLAYAHGPMGSLPDAVTATLAALGATQPAIRVNGDRSLTLYYEVGGTTQTLTSRDGGRTWS